jgi:hypothetical protein
MIDTCKSGAQPMQEKIKQFMTSPAGVFCYALFTGMFGILILLSFLSMVFAASDMPLILPLVIAFNAAAGGYSLIDKSKDSFPRKKSALLAIAVLLTITGCSLITLFCPWESPFDPVRYIISGLSALVACLVGAWIGNKSKEINKSSHS